MEVVEKYTQMLLASCLQVENKLDMAEDGILDELVVIVEEEEENVAREVAAAPAIKKQTVTQKVGP